MVAHSFSGVFLPLLHDVAEVLVFEAAIVPEPGRSVVDQFTSDSTMLERDWVAAGARWLDPSQHAALAREFLFHDCPDSTTEWALGTIEVFNTQRLVREPCPLDAWPDIRSVSIICTRDRTVNADWSRTAAARVRAEVVELDAGHSPHVCQADAVARILHDVAKAG